MNTTFYFAACRPTGWGVGHGGSGLLYATVFSLSSWRSGRPLPPAGPDLNQSQVTKQTKRILQSQLLAQRKTPAASRPRPQPIAGNKQRESFSLSSWRSGRPLPPAGPGLNQSQVTNKENPPVSAHGSAEDACRQPTQASTNRR